MPEAEHFPDARQPAIDPSPRRTRRRRRRPFLVRYWQIIPIGALLLASPWIWKRINTPLFQSDPLPGYLSDPSLVEEEYRQFTGRPLQDSDSLQRFDNATKLMLAKSYRNAAISLEQTSKKLPLPAVFNDLGVLYAKIKDVTRAQRSFRDALARNHEYPPARANLKLLHITGAIDPGEIELEPNDTPEDANAIWMDRPVNASIQPQVADIDCFWFVTPRPPRDRISVQVLNRSDKLVPHLLIYDADGKMLSGVRDADGPGASLRYDFSAPPNSLYRIQVNGSYGSSGEYTMSVTSLRAYDVYEPNDDIQNATRIVLGQPIEANIMDGADTDYYAFESREAGKVTVDVVPHGATAHDGTLIAGLSTFAADLQHLDFGPDPENPGLPLHYVMNVDAHQVYYLQVFGKNDTIGLYTLTVK